MEPGEADQGQAVNDLVRGRRRVMVRLVAGWALLTVLLLGTIVYLDQPGFSLTLGGLPLHGVPVLLFAFTNSNRDVLRRPVLGRIALLLVICLIAVSLAWTGVSLWAAPQT